MLMRYDNNKNKRLVIVCQILSKTRNRLKDYKGVAYFRAKENLNHIMHAKKVLGKRITDSLN
jgi:hypothetical protein